MYKESKNLKPQPYLTFKYLNMQYNQFSFHIQESCFHCQQFPPIFLFFSKFNKKERILGSDPTKFYKTAFYYDVFLGFLLVVGLDMKCMC